MSCVAQRDQQVRSGVRGRWSLASALGIADNVYYVKNLQPYLELEIDLFAWTNSRKTYWLKFSKLENQKQANSLKTGFLVALKLIMLLRLI